MKKQSIDNEIPKTIKKYVSQSDVPACSLAKALIIAQALNDNYAKHPTKPLLVAQALDLSPTSSYFRLLTGASIAYGLTVGGYNADKIELTPLGKRIVSPTEIGDDLQAKREAVLKPRIIKEFLVKYNNSPIPQENISFNVLEDMGTTRDKVKETYALIMENSKLVGFLKIIKEKTYVDLDTIQIIQQEEGKDNLASQTLTPESIDSEQRIPVVKTEDKEFSQKETTEKDIRLKRVFITHGKNQTFIDPIKKLLEFGELESVVAVDKQSVSKPVPDKVMEEMRSCGAAIIHIDADEKFIDTDAKEHKMINSNVLIEIGAAMALYGRRYILLVKEGVSLPSNLQGLYEVRYDGDQLSGDITIKLLEAIKDIKNNPLP